MPKRLAHLPIDRISPNPLNRGDRVRHDDEDLALQDSIRTHGVLQPITVRALLDGAFQIVHGERRWSACKALGMATMDVLVEDQAAESADREQDAILSENTARRNLSPWELLLALRDRVKDYRMRAQASGGEPLSVPAVSKLIGITKSTGQRMWTALGRVDPASMDAIGASATLRVHLSLVDFERIGNIHSEDRVAEIARLERVYQEFASPHLARQTGAASGKKRAKIVLQDPTRTCSPSLVLQATPQITEQYRPTLDVRVSYCPFLDVASREERQQVLDDLRKQFEELLEAFERGSTDAEEPSSSPGDQDPVVIVSTAAFRKIGGDEHSPSPATRSASMTPRAPMLRPAAHRSDHSDDTDRDGVTRATRVVSLRR